MTLIIGVFSWGLMPPGPTQTANWFRGKKGWFTEREEFIMVNRLLRDDPTKGDMNNRQEPPSPLPPFLAGDHLWKIGWLTVSLQASGGA